MKKLLTLCVLIGILSGCAFITTGPQNAYVYPEPPTYPTPLYMSPVQAESRDVCINPADQMEILEHEIDWQIVYEKMKAIIDAINQER